LSRHHVTSFPLADSDCGQKVLKVEKMNIKKDNLVDAEDTDPPPTTKRVYSDGANAYIQLIVGNLV